MGSWATLNVGGQDVFHWKSEVDPTFLFLFTRGDVSYIPLKDPHDDPYANPTLVLKSTVKVLTDRLDALGVSAGDLDGCLQYGIDQQIKLLETMPPDAGGPEDDAAIQDLRNLTFEAWAKRVRGALATHVPFGGAWRDYSNLGLLLELWEDFDPRWLLRAVMEVCDPDAEVVLDLTDLELGGYLEAYDFDPQTVANVMFSSALLNGTPAVVITEGTNDAEFLQAAVEIRRPHLARFIKFYDFGITPGGASAALNTVKSFAAAGVNNRVIVLLDSDTAAREALRSIRNVQLPSHYIISNYPKIDLAANYPSTGPTGAHIGNVNGLACSIELYLGADVLTDPATRTLRPVVWRTHIRALNAYQGEVAGKAAIHQAFPGQSGRRSAGPNGRRRAGLERSRRSPGRSDGPLADLLCT